MPKVSRSWRRLSGMSAQGTLGLRTGSLGTALLKAELEAPERAVLAIFGL